LFVRREALRKMRLPAGNGAAYGEVETLAGSCWERAAPIVRRQSVTPAVLLDQVGDGGHAGAVANLRRARH
jgi:hypothetical protein